MWSDSSILSVVFTVDVHVRKTNRLWKCPSVHIVWGMNNQGWKQAPTGETQLNVLAVKDRPRGTINCYFPSF